jgi:hypothetical protein
MHAYIHAYTDMHTYIHTHTGSRTPFLDSSDVPDIHTYTHTYTHTHTGSRTPFLDSPDLPDIWQPKLRADLTGHHKVRICMHTYACVCLYKYV